jgi:inositol transport system permease protein
MNTVLKDSNARGKRSFDFVQLYSQFGVFIILFISMIIATLLSDAFLSSRNLINILRQNAVITIIACGAQMVLISGEVDLSPGSVVAFGGTIAAMVMAGTGSVLLAVVAGLAIGLLLGFINGFVITRFRIPSFIMTLATMQAARGGILAITKAQPISKLGSFTWIGQGYVGPVPVPIIILIVILIITWIIMNKLPYGRYMYAVGGNSNAAQASGINVASIKTKAFMFQGLMAGLGGVILMSRLNSGQPTAAVGYEFDAITAVIIGGTSMSGGIGNLHGTVAGALFVAVLVNIMTLMDVSAYYQQIVQGIIIALAVIIDVRVRSARKV